VFLAVQDIAQHEGDGPCSGNADPKARKVAIPQDPVAGGFRPVSTWVVMRLVLSAVRFPSEIRSGKKLMSALCPSMSVILKTLCIMHREDMCMEGPKIKAP
jgi:hypothetical protein